MFRYREQLTKKDLKAVELFHMIKNKGWDLNLIIRRNRLPTLIVRSKPINEMSIKEVRKRYR